MPPACTSRDMLARLVGFNTVSSRSNLELIAFVEDYLRSHGVASRRFPDASGDKAALHARIGPHRPGGIVLSGHSDVVPADPDDWNSDPFAVVERDGRLYGRGCADMKAFIAAALAGVPEMLAAPLKRPLHLCVSYDEEIGCLGVDDLLKALTEDETLRPGFAVIGEPTEMTVVHRHKSIFSLITEIQGREGHSSDPRQGVNAIELAVEFIGALKATAIELQDESQRMTDFDPPWSSLHIGVIRGGTARNVIPGRCVVAWEIRGLPGFDIEPIMQRIEGLSQRLIERHRPLAPETDIQTRIDNRVVGLSGEGHGDVIRLVQSLAAQNASRTVAYMTEAGLFEQAGIPAVVCGPGRIAQAHQPDEYIEIEQLGAVESFIKRVIAHACS